MFHVYHSQCLLTNYVCSSIFELKYYFTLICLTGETDSINNQVLPLNGTVVPDNAEYCQQNCSAGCYMKERLSGCHIYNGKRSR